MRAGMRAVSRTARELLLLAAPQTWAAAIVPALFSAVLAYAETGNVDVPMAACVLSGAVLMQSAANAFNDYSDYMKGTDKPENSPDRRDAVLVYGLDPHAALAAGLCFLLAAGLIGVYITMHRGVVPLLIGLCGAAAVAWYTAGGRPASYLPVGELLSGMTMGGLIPLAGYCVQTGELRVGVLWKSLPLCLGIALIMLTNNGCDIERDIEAGRRTLPCLLGRDGTRKLYRGALALWALSPFFALLPEVGAAGYAVCAAGLGLELGLFLRQSRLSLGPERRAEAMRGIVRLNAACGLVYMLALLAEV